MASGGEPIHPGVTYTYPDKEADMKVAYVVPDGIDAAVVRTALDMAGFSAALDIVGGEERLLIECQAGERERVREVIAGGVQSAYARSGLTIGAVTFRDDL
jgi:hypothetical protein